MAEWIGEGDLHDRTYNSLLHKVTIDAFADNLQYVWRMYPTREYEEESTFDSSETWLSISIDIGFVGVATILFFLYAAFHKITVENDIRKQMVLNTKRLFVYCVPINHWEYILF
jgi:hypothetical protein